MPQLGTALFVDSAVESMQNVTATTSTTPINISSGSIVNLTVNANTAVSVTGLVAGGHFTVQATNGGTNTLTFTGVKWAAGTAPTFSSGAGKIDVFTFMSVDGTNILGFVVGQAMA